MSKGEFYPGTLGVLLCFVALQLVTPVTALARTAYVAIAGTNEVAAFDTETGQIVTQPIPVDEASGALALTPDGRFALVACHFAGHVSVIDTQTNQVVGPPIDTTYDTSDIAISPDGRYAYVTSGSPLDAGAIDVIDIATRQRVGLPIHFEHRIGAIALTPDGRTAFVTSETGSVFPVDLQTGQIGPSIGLGAGLISIAMAPDGARAYVAVEEGGVGHISVIDVASRQVLGPPIEMGSVPLSLAVSPDGRFVYAANYPDTSISVIDTQVNRVVGEIPLVDRPARVTFSPDGKRAFVTMDFPGRVSVIDTTTRQVIGEPIEIGGTQASDIAVIPAQAPVASFSSVQFRPGVPSSFDGSRSADPEAQTLRYDWSFGDGQGAQNAGANPTHVYVAPGVYGVTLKLTDSEGCSTQVVFTGQTAYCNGSPHATQTQTVTAALPAIRVKCPASAKHHCRFRFQVVATPRKRSKTLSRLARATVRPGAAKIVPIEPKVRFAQRLATVDQLLVRGIRNVGRTSHHFIRRFAVIQ